MFPRLREVRVPSVLIWVVAWCGVSFLSASEAGAGKLITGPKAREHAKARNKEFREAWHRVRDAIDAGAQYSLGKAPVDHISASIQFIYSGNTSYVSRIPRRGVTKGMYTHKPGQVLLTLLGHPEMVVLGIKTKLPKALGKDMVMLLEDLTPRAVMAHKFPNLKKVPENIRLTGALADVLASERDRKHANVFVANDGSTCLPIDWDGAFGVREIEKRTMYSVFWKGSGSKLCYRKRQKSFSDLPAELQHGTLQIIERAEAGKLGQDFGIKSEHAELVHAAAQNVVAHGLDRAVKDFIQSMKTQGSSVIAAE